MTPTSPSERSPYFWALAVIAAVLLLSPIRKGDLPGYDDALYAHFAKNMVLSGDWLNIRSNGGTVLEHPPLLAWIQAAFFSVFGVSDPIAKLPSSLAGLGTIVLVYWLSKRLLQNSLQAAVAMFIMAATLYFLKYAARAMTDVPCTFLYLASICAWLLARDEQKLRWYMLTGVLGALLQLSRGMIGLGLPAILAIDLLMRRRPEHLLRFALMVIMMFVPLGLWYLHIISANREIFFGVHSTWLRNEVFGPLDPPWRRYTGAFEYLWMLAKSYWPWLPFMILGGIVVVREKRQRLSILPIWAIVIFVLCAAAKSRVLRYMLPAYPAFSILAALGLSKLVADSHLRSAFRVVVPVFALVTIAIAIHPPVSYHAWEIRPIAAAASAAVAPGEGYAFYDSGVLRFDEVNQLHWYGDRNLYFLPTPADLRLELTAPRTMVFVLDRPAYEEFIAHRMPSHMLAERGHLVCIRLVSRG